MRIDPILHPVPVSFAVVRSIIGPRKKDVHPSPNWVFFTSSVTICLDGELYVK